MHEHVHHLREITCHLKDKFVLADAAKGLTICLVITRGIIITHRYEPVEESGEIGGQLELRESGHRRASAAAGLRVRERGAGGRETLGTRAVVGEEARVGARARPPVEHVARIGTASQRDLPASFRTAAFDECAQTRGRELHAWHARVPCGLVRQRS